MLDVAIVTQGVILNFSMMKIIIEYNAMVLLTVVSSSNYLIMHDSVSKLYIHSTAETCAEAKFAAGFCKWQLKPMRKTCQVYRGNCYCDPYCVCFNDCCSDVQGTYIIMY